MKIFLPFSSCGWAHLAITSCSKLFSLNHIGNQDNEQSQNRLLVLNILKYRVFIILDFEGEVRIL